MPADAQSPFEKFNSWQRSSLAANILKKVLGLGVPIAGLGALAYHGLK